MEEFSFDYMNINYAEEKQKLADLRSKYNLKAPKPASSSGIGCSNNSNSSQQSSSSYSSSISRTNSSSSNSKNDLPKNKTKTSAKSQENKIKDKPSKTTVVSKNKSKYKDVVAILDLELLTTYGEPLREQLDVLEINYEIKSQIYNNLITWTYTEESDVTKDSDLILLILNWKDVVSYISTNSLITHIKMVSEMLSGKRISLGLYGFENYFKFWKSQKQNTQNKNKNSSEYKDSFKISRYELEYVLTELELRCACCHKFLENIQDLINIVSQYTKSIAQLPEKLEKQERFKNLDFYLMKDSRDCVIVDKNGNGFKRLWQQQLTCFEMVRLETAEAIIAKYPSPSQLFDAYENCIQSEGAKLLEDIPIRRAAGPLTSSRKIGPELSRKVHNFLTATDGNAVI